MLQSNINNQKIAPSMEFTVQVLLWQARGLLSFGRVVGDHRDLWIEINENMLLGFQKHDIIPPIEQDLRPRYHRTINKSNDNINTSFVKHRIYQKIHHIHNQSIYPLPTHIARSFEILEKLNTFIMHALDKNSIEK